MMKYTLRYTVLLLIFCIGCENTWDEHYGYEDDPRTAASSLTAWEILSSVDDYSKFVTLVKRAGYDKLLNSQRVRTVWAPQNKYITEEVMAYDSLSLDVKRFVKNHINSLALFKTKLIGRPKIQSLAGKVIPLYQNKDQNSPHYEK